MPYLSTKTDEKANENLFLNRGFKIVLISLLAAVALFMSGWFLGGWRESLILRAALQQIPDINLCY